MLSFGQPHGAAIPCGIQETWLLKIKKETKGNYGKDQF